MKITTTVLAAVLSFGASQVLAGPGGPGPRSGELPPALPHSDTNHFALPDTNYVGLLSGLCAPLTKFDTNNDSTVSSNEFMAASQSLVQELQSRLFEKYDTNSDGTISAEESQAVHEAQAEKWLERILTQFDRNKDGILSTNDFPRGPGRGELAKLLDLYDANDDGVISSVELIAAAELMAEDLQEEFLAKYDANKDGRVTSGQALAVHQAIVDDQIDALLEKFDLNGDGEVTSDEVNTVLQPRIGKRNRIGTGAPLGHTVH